MRIVVGTTSDLNTLPLTRWLTHTEDGAASGIEVVHGAPSALARLLEADEVTAALMPSLEIFRMSDFAIVPGVSISGQDDIGSIRAFSRLPWRATQTVALETSWATEAALLKILLAEQFDAHPAFVNRLPSSQPMTGFAEAELMVGEQALLFDGAGLNVLDLGHGWRRLTRLPFVYAVWMGRTDGLTPHIIQSLNTAKEWGLTQIEPIIREQAEKRDSPTETYRRSLTELIDYDLAEEHRQALETFGVKAYANGLLPEPPRPLRLAPARR